MARGASMPRTLGARQRNVSEMPAGRVLRTRTTDPLVRAKEESRMLGDPETRSESFEPRGRRARVSGLVAVLAAALSAAALASVSPASAATVLLHSAKSGELSGGRLTLRGVGPRVSYATHAGRSGTASVRWIHRRFFPPGAPATGALHVAGYHGGDEPTYRLSRPRYNAARHTVSYRAKPLDKKRLPGRTARAAGIPVRRFGAASLSIVPHERVTGGDNGGNDCRADIEAAPGFQADLQSYSNWDTDTWADGSPPFSLRSYDDKLVESDGGLGRGCHFETVWNTYGSATITIDVTWPWTQLPSSTCKVSNPQAFSCTRADSGGEIIWVLRYFG
jgi:hypothetical protein